MTTLPTLGFIGGTGKLGRGLAIRLAAAGYPILIGSRIAARAVDACASLRERVQVAGSAEIRMRGAENRAVVNEADVVFLTLPYATLDDFLREHGARLGGKIVVDVVNPLRVSGDRVEVAPVDAGCVGRRVQRLAAGARVVSGFKNAAAGHLLRIERAVRGDIPLAADDVEAKAVVASLVGAIPELRAVDAGPLANGGLLEALTALELNLNRIHHATTAVHFIGLDSAGCATAKKERR